MVSSAASPRTQCSHQDLNGSPSSHEQQGSKSRRAELSSTCCFAKLFLHYLLLHQQCQHVPSSVSSFEVALHFYTPPAVSPPGRTSLLELSDTLTFERYQVVSAGEEEGRKKGRVVGWLVGWGWGLGLGFALALCFDFKSSTFPGSQAMGSLASIVLASDPAADELRKLPRTSSPACRKTHCFGWV